MNEKTAKSQGVDESEVIMTVNCRSEEIPDYFYYGDDFEDSEECQCNVTGCPECDERALENYDCGKTSSGLCLHAGSEDCDFECPFSYNDEDE